jgi:hypothetical protein
MLRRPLKALSGRRMKLFIGPKAAIDALVASASSPGDTPGDTKIPPTAQAAARKCTQWEYKNGSYKAVSWLTRTRICCDFTVETWCDEDGKNCTDYTVATNCSRESDLMNITISVTSE